MANTPVRFLAVSLDADSRRVRVAMETLKLTLPVGTPEAELLAPLGLDSVPATIFVDATGLVIAKLGISSKAELRTEARRLLAPTATAQAAAAR